MSRRLLVFGEKTFEITIPDDAKVTFGPWSPPGENARYVGERALTGTLRVYKGGATTQNVLAVFSGVRSFRDTSINYREEVAREEGAVIWKSDENGYERQEKATIERAWVEPELPPALETSEETEVGF